MNEQTEVSVVEPETSPDRLTVEITLPNGDAVRRELALEEVNFWVSLGMYLAHGFHAISTVHAAKQMDDEASVDLDPQEQVVN